MCKYFMKTFSHTIVIVPIIPIYSKKKFLLTNSRMEIACHLGI